MISSTEIMRISSNAFTTWSLGNERLALIASPIHMHPLPGVPNFYGNGFVYEMGCILRYGY